MLIERENKFASGIPLKGRHICINPRRELFYVLSSGNLLKLPNTLKNEIPVLLFLGYLFSSCKQRKNSKKSHDVILKSRCFHIVGAILKC